MKTIHFKPIQLAIAAVVACLPQLSEAQADYASPADTVQAAVTDDLPAYIIPNSALAEVVKLAQAGVSESIILTFINNSESKFNLTSDQIIYLKDVGLPDEAVLAMMKRDQQLGSGAIVQTPTPTTTVAAQPVEVTQNYFYQTLSPYGSWVDVDGYGLCWRPSIVVYDSSWQPYCDHGHWINTDAGWYWVSDYSWGTTTFHYGRWFRDSRFGWCWWPDTVWAPSWVCWRYSDNYCGWAPLPPRCVYREGVGIFYNGVAVGANFDFGISVSLFTFVPTQRFCDPHPAQYRVPHDNVQVVYNQTTIINNYNINTHDRTVINAGIAPERISPHAPIQRVSIRVSDSPNRHGDQLNGDSIVINRPRFNGDPAEALHSDNPPRPARSNRPDAPRLQPVAGGRDNPVPPSRNDGAQENRNLPIVQRPPQNQNPPSREIGSPVQPSQPTRPRQDFAPGQNRNNQPTVDQNPSGFSPANPPQRNVNPPRNDFSQPVPNQPNPPQVQIPPQERNTIPPQNVNPRRESNNNPAPTRNNDNPPAEVRHVTPPLQPSQPAPVTPSQPRISPSENRQVPSTPAQSDYPRNNQRPSFQQPPQQSAPVTPVTPPVQIQPPAQQRPQPQPNNPNQGNQGNQGQGQSRGNGRDKNQNGQN